MERSGELPNLLGEHRSHLGCSAGPDHDARTTCDLRFQLVSAVDHRSIDLVLTDLDTEPNVSASS